MTDIHQRYLDAIKANAEVAMMNATLQADLMEARDLIAALESQLGEAHATITRLEADARTGAVERASARVPGLRRQKRREKK